MQKAIKISILCEDQARMGYKDKAFLAQHGFSVFIEAGGRNILFDTGAGDVVLHNAKLFGIDPDTADLIVLSHGHWDHTDGLKAMMEKSGHRWRLLAHPGVFADRHNASGQYNGIGLTRNELEARFDLVLSEVPYRIAETIYFLGGIPRRNDFEARQTNFFFTQAGNRYPDFIPDDSALAIRTPLGLVIVSGCSHAGICNIVEYARQVTGQHRLHMVMGGFHLLANPTQLERTIDFFKSNTVAHLYPLHCTDLPALSRFYQAFGIQKLCAGDSIAIDTGESVKSEPL